MRWTARRCSDAARIARVALALWLACAPMLAQDEREPRPPGAADAEVRRLKEELRALGAQERTVLDEIRRLETELRLRQVEVREVGDRIAAIDRAIEERTEGLSRLEGAQIDRRRYLAFRMREMYKRGPGAPLRVLLGDAEAADALRGVRYAAFLNERDARTLGAFRGDATRLATDRESLAAERAGLEAARAEQEEARGALARSRAEQASYLASIRSDRRKSEDALRDLESAARALGGIADGAAGASGAVPPATEASRLRGRLDWPLSGKVSAGFGKVVHPQFKTVVPHPGLDIEASEGSDFRAVLDGKVVYSAPLRGYGLTVLVEHAGGLLSVYAHAAVLLVEKGEAVEQGQVLGKVGDTGSLRGPFLYFELRQDGKPTDPTPWLRRR